MRPKYRHWLSPSLWQLNADLHLTESGDLIEAAAKLFDMLHVADKLNPISIAVAPIPNIGIGEAINERLARAAAPRN